MPEVCPRCEGSEIILLPDRSGRCKRCNISFMKSRTVDIVSPKPLGQITIGSEAVRDSASEQSIVNAVAQLNWRATQTDFSRSISYQKEKNLRNGGIVIYFGSLLLTLAPLLSIFLLQTVVSGMVGRNVSWGELYDALVETGLAGVICAGFFAVIIMGLLGFLLGYQMRNVSYGSYSNRAPIGAIIVGAIGGFMAIATVGGIIGLMGGILVAIGGGIGLTSS